MGLGYWLSEKVIYNKDSGELLSDSTFKYHVPQCRDIPQNLVVSLKKNSYSSDLILGSKGNTTEFVESYPQYVVFFNLKCKKTDQMYEIILY